MLIKTKRAQYSLVRRRGKAASFVGTLAPGTARDGLGYLTFLLIFYQNKRNTNIINVNVTLTVCLTSFHASTADSARA